jgi:FMN-dependent oxidoreductase (nitrilotriacetate monooxygenase family)
LTLVAFMQAQNCTNLPSSWRHTASMTDFLSPEYFQRIGRILEAGKFHIAFFDDRLAMPDRYGDDPAEAIKHGVRVVKMDLMPIMTAMGLATRQLGIAGTCSTTYFEPFHVARAFATLDHMLGGRVGWNVVTSFNDSEARNMGHDAHLEHDLRYDRADEFIQAVLGHWDTWEDDAILLDKQTGVFADPAKVHRLDHRGDWFKTRGPFTVPRTPQGRPVVIQAGMSGRGRAFAGRWAEVIFANFANLEFARRDYKEIKDGIAAAGRDPELVKILPGAYCVVGETRTIAEEKYAYIESLAHPSDSTTLLGEVLNLDFASKDLDEPFSDEELAAISGGHTMRDRVVRLSGKRNPTTRDFIQFSGRGTIRDHPRFIGSPKDVADQMEEWFETRACDGFVMAASHVPGAYEDFVRLAVPELQRRGLHQKEYRGVTLRENLGLPRAERLDWKLPAVGSRQ